MISLEKERGRKKTKTIELKEARVLIAIEQAKD